MKNDDFTVTENILIWVGISLAIILGVKVVEYLINGEACLYAFPTYCI